MSTSGGVGGRRGQPRLLPDFGGGVGEPLRSRGVAARNPELPSADPAGVDGKTRRLQTTSSGYSLYLCSRFPLLATGDTTVTVAQRSGERREVAPTGRPRPIGVTQRREVGCRTGLAVNIDSSGDAHRAAAPPRQVEKMTDRDHQNALFPGELAGERLLRSPFRASIFTAFLCARSEIWL